MRFLLLADIHIGSIKDTTYCYNIITDIIDKEVMFKKTDAVIILGDYFDRLFKANEEYISLAINVMSHLVRACAKNKTKIRIIYGTESHEMNQYKLFNYHLSSSKVDMKLITTCTEEEIFPNVNILYVPEEYVDDKHEFYKDTLYSGKHYNYIFGHGNIIEGLPANMAYHISTTKSLEKQVPKFTKGDISSACDLSVWGHIHIHTKICDNVYYLGSLFRKSFGDEGAKGYAIIEDGKFTFVENELAYIYKTYEFDEDSDIYKSSDNIMKEINKIKKENKEIFDGTKEGRIRLIFNIPNDLDPSFRDNIRDILFNDKLFTSMIKESNKDLIDEVQAEIEDELEFIIDNSMNKIDKIHTFINKQYDYQLPIDMLTKYINEPLELWTWLNKGA